MLDRGFLTKAPIEKTSSSPNAFVMKVLQYKRANTKMNVNTMRTRDGMTIVEPMEGGLTKLGMVPGGAPTEAANASSAET